MPAIGTTPTSATEAGAARWTPAGFYRQEGADILCTLCPRACRLQDDGLGFCAVRRRKGDRLETATRASAVQHLDPIERKPLYHYRPGTMALTLAAPGCSLACTYCINHRLSQFGRARDAPWRAVPVEPAAIVAAAAAGGHVVAFSYTEPSLAAELTLDLAMVAGARGVDVVWKSNGFLTATTLDAVAPHLSAVNLDLKAPDEQRHRALTGGALAPVLAALRGFAAHGVWVEVSTPLIPGFNDDDRSLATMAAAVAAVGPDVPWHLVRFSPAFRMRRRAPTRSERLARGVELGRAAGLRFVYVERALGEAGRTTFCPKCHAVLVRRQVWGATATLASGRCPGCREPISGRW